MSYELVELGKVCKFVRGPFGGSLKKNIFVEEGYAIYEQQHAIYNQFDEIRYFIDEKKFNEMSRFELLPNDLIMSCSGTMGKVAIVPSKIKKGIINQALLKLTPSNKIDGLYLKWLMTSLFFQERLNDLSSGAAIQNVASVSLLKQIKIPVPSLTTQQKIVEKLDSIFTEVDIAMVAAEANAKNADALFQNYLTRMFEELIAENNPTSLRDICQFENGDRGKNYPSKQHQVESGIPFINAGDLKDDWRISRKGMAYITPERYNLLGAGKVKVGDLLFCLRGSLGKCGIVEDIECGAIASSLVIIRPIAHSAFSKFIYWFLSSSVCEGYIEETKGGAAQPNLSAKSVMNFKIPLLDLNKQETIATSIDNFYFSTNIIKKSYIDKVIELNLLKQSILQQTFNGELVKD